MAHQNFDQTSQKLELPGSDAALVEEKSIKPTYKSFDVDTLVQEVRHQVYASIKMQCGMMRLLGVSQPVELHNIYTNVNILEQISSRKRVEIADILNVCVADEFDRPGLGIIFEQQVPGLEVVKQYTKLMVLGKPGSGKTTFLKHIAIQCISGKFQANQVPIFISLKNLAETKTATSLLEYINGEFTNYGITNNQVVEQLLSQGRAIILLDGLDEVLETYRARILQEISTFSAKFHANNFVITCRMAAREYTFEEFTEVEVADFDQEQIATFVNNWFFTKEPSQGKKFIQKLKNNHPIRELATNPLLLTLLCLTFEELGFPPNRLELYQEGLKLLLKKWDVICNIERDQVYKNLSVQHKKDLLSKIAQITFERGDYFFKQQELEQHITDYIWHLPDASTENEALRLDACAILKSIETQHGLLVERAKGIYSFSHLTFQEYFTAKEIATNSNPQALETALKQLSSHITENRWREVFLMIVGMLRNADYFLQLLKEQVDNLIVEDKHLQEFLNWLSQKSCAVNGNKLGVIRAFYLDLSLGIDLKVEPALSLALKLDPTLALALKLDLDLDLELNFALSLTRNLDYTLARTLSLSLDRILSLNCEQDLQRLLQQLKVQLPELDNGEESFNKWWKAKGKTWIKQLKTAQIQYRNLGYNWQFNAQQKQALKQYHDANKLLVDCLKSTCYTTNIVRQELEETLLLQFAEIERIESRD